MGCAPPGPGNAVELADTPVFDRLWREFPHTTIEASGEAAGLPPGQMGNCEVGHLTIGAGRRLYQDLMRVNRAIEDGSFFENAVLRAAFERGNRVHLLGLVSHGGVHSHIDHLQALLRFAPEKTWIHAFTDGRDVSPTSAVRDLATLPQDRIATVVRPLLRDGPRPALGADAARVRRDRRTASAPRRPIRSRRCRRATTPASPTSSSSRSWSTARRALEPGDTAIFFNFRPDRGRQLSRLLLDARLRPDDDDALRVRPRRRRSRSRSRTCRDTLAEVLAEHGLTQLHVAETEKYAHVTYFFNGGREEAWPGEDRILVPSPRDVPSYDHKPEMSADEVADRVVDEIGDGYAFCVVNFANPDMVGHTGSIPAVIQACETADRCLGRVVERVDRARRRLRSSPPTTATPSRCSRTTASARTPRTRRTRCRSSSPSPAPSSARAASSPIWRRRCSTCWESVSRRR